MINSIELEKINLEQAEELKTLGFPFSYEVNKYFSSYFPSLDLVSKWLRDKMGIVIEISVNNNESINYKTMYVLRCFVLLGDHDQPFYGHKRINISGKYSNKVHNTYESALSGGIYDAINYLKSK